MVEVPAFFFYVAVIGLVVVTVLLGVLLYYLISVVRIVLAFTERADRQRRYWEGAIAGWRRAIGLGRALFR